MILAIDDVLFGWNKENIGNLAVLLGLDKEVNLKQIKDKFKWLYHSKTRANAESAVRNVGSFISSLKGDKKASVTQKEKLRKMPTYNELLTGACKHVKAFEEDATIQELEMFVSHAVIIAALQRMKPRERVKFFQQEMDTHKMTQKAKLKGAGINGPATTFALLGAAQASGFGVYLASTTALGFLTHAIGITLPFAVYTGMTSTIAFVIGPVGWLGAGIWGAWKLTQPSWKKMIPALIYISAINSKQKLESSQ